MLLSLFEAQILKVILLQGLVKEEFRPALFLTAGIKRSFFVSGPLMARQDPWGSYSSTLHFGNQLVALKGEATFAFVSEMRVHSSRRDICGYPQAEKLRIDFFSPSH